MSKDKELKILLVCTGNTCRSPMAEGLLKKMLKEIGLENVSVSSAGTAGLSGYPVTLFAVEAAKVRGVDISGHTSRKLTKQKLKQTDLILVMGEEHLERIKRLDKNSSKKSYLLKLFPEKENREGDFNVRDPIGGILDDYNQSFLEIEQEIERIIPYIKKLSAERETK